MAGRNSWFREWLIRYGDASTLRTYLSQYGPGPRHEYTNMLGLACRYRDAGLVGVLLDSGVSFPYYARAAEASKSGIMSKDRASRFAEPYLFFLRDTSAGDSGLLTQLDDKEMRIASGKVYQEIIGLMVRRQQDASFDPSVLLFLAVVRSDTETVEALGEHGVLRLEGAAGDCLSGRQPSMSRTAFGKIMIEEVMRGLCSMDREPSEFFSQLSEIAGGPIRFGEKELMCAIRRYGADTDALAEAAVEHTDILQTTPVRRIANICIDHDCVAALETTLRKKGLRSWKAYSETIDYAKEQNASQSIVSCLLKYQNMHCRRPAVVMETQTNPFAMSEIRRYWKIREDSDGLICILGYKGGLGPTVCIPERAGNKPVGRLQWYSSSEADDIEELIIPGSVSCIPYDSFYSMKSLRKLILSEGVERIGSGTFQNCRALKEIVLPATIRSIEAFAFKNCSSLCRMQGLSDTVTIGGGAFGGCTALIQPEQPLILANTLIACDLSDSRSFFEVPEGVHVDPLALQFLPLLMERSNINDEETVECDGDIVIGRFPHKGFLRKAPLKWIPVQQEEDRVLLMTRDIIAIAPQEMLNWSLGCSDIWRWLNSTFLDRAFTDEERARMIPVKDRHGRNGFSDVLVHIPELRYVENMPAETANAEVTPYAHAQLDVALSALHPGWLVSDSFDAVAHSVLGYDGKQRRTFRFNANAGQHGATKRVAGIRPAIWVH